MLQPHTPGPLSQQPLHVVSQSLLIDNFMESEDILSNTGLWKWRRPEVLLLKLDEIIHAIDN